MSPDLSPTLSSHQLQGQMLLVRTLKPRKLTLAHIVVCIFAAAESYIAHVQTFEEVPGSSAKKPRYLILAGSFSLTQ